MHHLSETKPDLYLGLGFNRLVFLNKSEKGKSNQVSVYTDETVSI